MSMPDATLACRPSLSPSPIADRRLAASQMSGPTRRAFEAEMAVHDGGGNPLRAATLCGWGRQTVALGVAERRTGGMSLGAPSACSGRKRWEDRQQQAAAALRPLAEAPAQHDPTCRTRCTSTRLTAHAALQARREQGARAEPWPAPRTMAAVVHRRGFRWRTVVQATPPKQIQETDVLVDQRKNSGPSRGLRQRHTLAQRGESDGAQRRVGARRSPPGRPPRP
jgi:hypothetical protein